MRAWWSKRRAEQRALWEALRDPVDWEFLSRCNDPVLVVTAHIHLTTQRMFDAVRKTDGGSAQGCKSLRGQGTQGGQPDT